jgi:hypothetical protein
VNGLIRFAFSALLLGTALAGLVAVYPECAVALGVDIWNLPALGREVEDSERVSTELEEWGQTLMARIRRKRGVTLDLLEGRLSLLEAADRFRALSVRGPHDPADPIKVFPGRTETERVCRQVISRVFDEATVIDPQRAEAVRAALEWELEQRLAGGKTISWPEQPTP